MKIKQIVAMVLAAAIILSNAPLKVFANEETQVVETVTQQETQQTQVEEAEQTETVVPTEEEEQTEVVVPTEEEEQTEVVVPTEEEEQIEVVVLTEEEEQTETVTQTEEEEQPETETAQPMETAAESTVLLQKLTGTTTIEDLYVWVVINEEQIKDLTADEVAAVKAHANTLYDASTIDKIGCYNRTMERLGEPQIVADKKDLSGGGAIDGWQTIEWKLETDATLWGTLTIAYGSTVIIDLNGCVLTVYGNLRLAVPNGTLIIKDSNPQAVHYGINNNGDWTYVSDKPYDGAEEIYGGIITGKGNVNNWGGAFCVEPSGILEIHGGTISNFTSVRGGVVHSVGTLRMFGGTLSGNIAATEGAHVGCGGAINSRGSFLMAGGTITNNTAENGGGITIGGGTFTMLGGAISENRANKRDGHTYETGNGGGIYLWRAEYAAFNDNPVAKIAGGEICDNTSVAGGGVFINYYAQFTATGGRVSGNTAVNGGGIYNVETISVANATIFGNTADYGGGIHNTGTISMVNATVSGNTTWVDGAGIHNSGTIAMENTTVSNNISHCFGGGIYNYGTITLGNSTISNNECPWGGGGIYNYGNVVMDGGAISDNRSPSGCGGGIYNKNSFIMNSGSISGNRAGTAFADPDPVDQMPVYSEHWGGGIYSEGGDSVTEMHGGTISRNTAASGGGVGLWYNAQFYMNGGTIGGDSMETGNKAYGTGGPGNGGAVYVNGELTRFHFYSGTIQYNWARRYGGAINLNEGGKLIFYGEDDCIIQHNSANNGGGVSQEKGECAITIPNDNVKIQYNIAREDKRETADYLKADGYGGGLFIEMGEVTINGGIISHNESVAGGGIALRVQRVPGNIMFTMSNGTFSGNKAVETGGGIDIYADIDRYDGEMNAVQVNLLGGLFQNNETTAGTGGSIDIFARVINSTGVLNIGEMGTAGPQFIGNKAATNGGAIRVRGGDVNLYSGTFIQNTAGEYGGGITVNGGSFEMFGGTIGGDTEEKTNTAGIGGGGIAVRVKELANDIFAKIHGGSIIGNKAVETGGGMDIYADSERAGGEKNKVEVDLYGGLFQNNETTAGTGGGIDIFARVTNSTGVLNIGEMGTAGPQFIGNKAATNGGAIRVRGGDVNLYSGTFIQNTAGEYGGGITVNGGSFEMFGGTIGGDTEEKANTAGIGGGGIAVRVKELANDILVEVFGGSVIGNRAVQTGGGMDILADSERAGGEKNTVQVNLYGGLFQNNKTTAGTGGGIDIFAEATNSTAVLNIGKAGTAGPQFVGNTAATNGGAMRVLGGDVNLYSGTITKNVAQQNGGAISINGGDFEIAGGAITENEVKEGYGGALALNTGLLLISGGEITKNTAQIHGGGIAVSNGEVIMVGGRVSDNLATTGDGGGMYVTSYGALRVPVKIFSGEICDNRAPMGSGGALAVNGGSGDAEILVQTGLNLYHTFAEGSATINPIPHDRNGETGTDFIHTSCPVIQNNSSLVSGGGIFVTGGGQTNLNIYCLHEGGNTTEQDADHTGVLSNFMRVDGGKVVISSSETGNDGEIDKDTTDFGNVTVLNSIRVFAGELYLYGNTDNPSFAEVLTVDYRSPTDKFEDHRVSDKVLRLTYNENFKDANGNPKSTLKAYDIEKGAAVTIAELLFQHPGYTIQEWNTKPDGSGDTYVVGDEYLFIKYASEKDDYELEGRQQYQVDDLHLYAIWNVNQFIVEYHHGIAEGEIYSGNMDGQHIFAYDKEANLERNRFVYPGYAFQHWSYTDDHGNPATLADGQLVKNLTEVKGGTVHLVAVWEVCPHSYAYTAEGAVITQTCTICTKSASVTLLAEDAIYDGNLHMYTVSYTDKSFFEPEVTCSAVKFGKTEAPQMMYVDAGIYTITTNVVGSDVQATLVYYIQKADQRAPASLPTYNTANEDNHTVNVHQIANELISEESGALIEYMLRYSKGDGSSIDLGWRSDASGQDVVFTLPEVFTLYSVYSRYPETDNYNASQEKIAMSAFFYEGGIMVYITPTEGVTYTEVESARSLDVLPSLEPGYYLTDGQFYIHVLRGNNGGYVQINNATSGMIAANGERKFHITASGTPTEDVEIYLELGYASKTTTIYSQVAPNQVFGVVFGDGVISRDSAYTAYFEVTNYNKTVYMAPELSFDPQIPSGTKLIMMDKGNNTWWYYNVEQATDSIVITQFRRMGSTENDKFVLPAGNFWRLQVIVDFSQVAQEDLLANNLRLNTCLEIRAKGQLPENAPTLERGDTNPGVVATLKNTGFSLTGTGGEGLMQSLSYAFDYAAPASKWNYRELALILRPTTNFPADAMLRVTHNGISVEQRPVLIQTDGTTQTAFLIPLDGFDGSVTLELQSADAHEGTYTLSAQLVAAHSIAEDASADGTVLATLDSIPFVVSKMPVSIMVTHKNDYHLFQTNSPVELNVQVQPGTLPEGYKVVAAQEQKLDGQSEYLFVGVYHEVVGTDGNRTVSFLAPSTAGNYRIRFHIETQNGTEVVQTLYYFLVQ